MTRKTLTLRAGFSPKAVPVVPSHVPQAQQNTGGNNIADYKEVGRSIQQALRAKRFAEASALADRLWDMQKAAPTAIGLGLIIQAKLAAGRADEANNFADRLWDMQKAAPTAIGLGLIIQAKLAAGRADEANNFADMKWEMEESAPTAIGLGLIIQAKLAAGRTDEANYFAGRLWDMQKDAPTAIGLGLIIQAKLAVQDVTAAKKYLLILHENHFESNISAYLGARISFFEGLLNQAKTAVCDLISQPDYKIKLGVVALLFAILNEEEKRIFDKNHPLYQIVHEQNPAMAEHALHLLLNNAQRFASQATLFERYTGYFAATNWDHIEVGAPVNGRTVLQMADVPDGVRRGTAQTVGWAGGPL